jgi:hypothetical protein
MRDLGSDAGKVVNDGELGSRASAFDLSSTATDSGFEYAETRTQGIAGFFELLGLAGEVGPQSSVVGRF